MTPVSLTCPYCNSLVVMPRLPEGDQRIRCPRCQELFPYHGQPGAETAVGARTDGSASQAMLAAPGAAAVSGGGRLSNRALARIVVAVMALMAAVALLFAWNTTDERRQHDGQKAEGEPEPVPVVAPGKLAGLGYLPGDVNWLAGIHVGELWDQRSIREILERLKQHRELRLQDLENSTRLKLKDIDHVVIGVKLAIPPPIVAVVRTRKPYRVEELLGALEAGGERADTGRKGVHQFPLKEFRWRGEPLKASVWCADERTLVFAMFGQDIKSLPTAADPSTARFAAPIQRMLDERLLGTQLWWIGQAEQLPPLLALSQKLSDAPLLVSKLGQEELVPLSDLRWLRAWTQFSADKVQCQAEAECKDPAAAKKLKDLLAERGVESKKKLPFLEGNDRLKRLAGDLEQKLIIEQKNELLTMKAESTIEAINGALATNRPNLKSQRRGGYSAQ